jgi:hypothetical protein
MKREYFCYGTSTDGTVLFVKDIDGNVQLFDEDRLSREVEQRGCLSAKIGHSPLDKDQFICYWTKRDGAVEFALNINKNVQLFSKLDAEASKKIHGCMIAQIGFTGIMKDGTPASATQLPA